MNIGEKQIKMFKVVLRPKKPFSFFFGFQKYVTASKYQLTQVLSSDF